MNMQTTCVIWTALQAQHMSSATEEIFKEIPRDFNIRWNSVEGKQYIITDCRV